MVRIPVGRNRLLVLELRRKCRHRVLGICPRCYPSEVRTLRNRKLCAAIAWLERLGAVDPHVTTVAQLRRMARDALTLVAEMTRD